MPKKKMPRGNPNRRLSQSDLKKMILDWQKSKPEVFTLREIENLLDKTVLKRFGDGEKLLGEVGELLEELASEKTIPKETAAAAIQKIDNAVGVMKWAAAWANTGWKSSPPILWNRPTRRT